MSIRSSRRTALALTSAAVVIAASLTACSSSGSGSDKGSGSVKNAAAAALVPKSIAKKGTLVFALDATYPPDEFVGTDGKTIQGVDADLANALAPVLGLKAELTNATFATIIPGLTSGKFDVGLSSFTDTKEREKTVDFVTYFKAGEGFYIKAGSTKKFDGLASLCGHTVAVENGTTEQTDANTQAKKCSVKVQTYDKQTDANLAVSSGRADVGFADSQVAAYIVKQSNGQFENSGTAFAVAPYGIALPKGNGMAKAVQAGLKALIANGKYKAILTKWGVTDGAITDPVINGAES